MRHLVVTCVLLLLLKVFMLRLLWRIHLHLGVELRRYVFFPEDLLAHRGLLHTVRKRRRQPAGTGGRRRGSDCRV